jgi:hypothetical protein
MGLIPTEHKEINQTNASKPTGPKSVEGEAYSRYHALRQGLRAETRTRPNEDPAALAVREQEGTDFYQPHDPGAACRVQQAVRATIQLDRGARFQTATFARQVRSAAER